MKLNCFPNHRYDKGNFGMQPRGIFLKGLSEGPRKGVQGVEIPGTDSETLRQEVENKKSAFESNKKLIEEKVAAYNRDYENDPWFRDAKFYEKVLKIDFKDVDAIDSSIAQINKFLETKFKVGDEIRQFKYTTDYPSEKRELQGERIKKIQELLVNRKSILEALKAAITSKTRRSKVKSVQRQRHLQEAVRKRTEWEKRPAYSELKRDYNDVVEGIIEDPQFESLWLTEGKEDPVKRKENEKLFFAILNKETNEFRTDFVLGENFGNDPKENKENFPYLYHEWIAENAQGVQQNIENSERRVKEKQDEVAKIDSVGTIVSDLDSRVASDADLTGKISENFQDWNPFNNLDKAKFEDDQKYYIGIRDGLVKLKKYIADNLGSITGDPKYTRFARELRTAKDKIKKHIDLANEQVTLEGHKNILKEAEDSFTKENLSKNRQKTIELLMKKYMKAMLIVDKPYGEFGGSFHRNLHPGVRRMMIATVFREGVARTNAITGEYIDDMAAEYKGFLMNLRKSGYYERGLKERFLDKEQREFLIIGRYAWLALYTTKFLEDEVIGSVESKKGLASKESQDAVKRLKANIAEQAKTTTTTTRRNELELEIDNDIAEIQRFTKIKVTESNYHEILTKEEERLVRWTKFHQKTEQIIKTGNREEIHNYINELSEDTDPDGQLFAAEIKSYQEYINSVDITYNTFDLEERTTEGYLERMGVNWEGIYEAYLSYITKNPENEDMLTDNWGELMSTPEGTAQLANMLEEILPSQVINMPDNIRLELGYSGKGDLLDLLRHFHDPGTADKRLRGESDGVAWSILDMVKQEIRAEEKMKGWSERAKEEARSRLEGKTWGDKITEYAKGVLDMAIGPGQSIANRAAGLVMIIGAWKLAYKAYKGEGKAKYLGWLAIAGAVGLGIKHITGEGPFERASLSGVAEALDGTYESVLLDRGEKNSDFKEHKISPNEHAAALMEMEDVPFSRLVEWYNATDEDGRPLKEGDSRAQRPSQIDVYNIVKGKEWNERDENARANLVVKEAMENFFMYVGGKDQKPETGKKILTEIYINPIQSKHLSETQLKHATRFMPPILIQKFRNNPSLLTWKSVLAMEIKPSDVAKVKESGKWERLKRTIEEVGVTLHKWTRQSLEQPLTEGVKEFAEYFKTELGPKTAEWFGKLGEEGAYSARRLKNSVEFWYDGHKYEIQKVIDGHLELIGNAAMLPFEVIGVVDNMLVPWASSKLSQMREILRPDKWEQIPHELNENDIGNVSAVNAAKETVNSIKRTIRTLKKIEREKKRLNSTQRRVLKNARKDLEDVEKILKKEEEKNAPKEAFYGVYQNLFNEAFTKNNLYDKSGETKRESIPVGYYEGKKTDTFHNGIGYYISKTNLYNTNIEKNPQLTTSQRINKMREKAYEDAIRFYLNKDKTLKREEVELYMYPIHMIVKGGENKPEALYFFWRMPLKRSREFFLKSTDRWPDYKDPNKIKHEPPFIVDPGKGILENLQMAYAYEIPWARKVGTAGTIAVAQYLRAMFNLIELGGIIANVPIKGKKMPKWLKELTVRDEETLQEIDEWSGAAGHPLLALSEFYSDSHNASEYDKALKEARKERRKLFLGDAEFKPVKGKGKKRINRKSNKYEEEPPGYL